MKLKHTLLALGAAAALGAAGSAHALTFFGHYSSTSASAKASKLTVGDGEGQMLIAPYFNAQGQTRTVLHITNTDHWYSKALRVHVRGAANGDILKSFTALLAPGDTWTFDIRPDGGKAPLINSGHPACVFTDDNGASGKLSENLSLDYLAPYISNASKITHAGEGYIEVITMADIEAQTGFDIRDRNCGALNDLVRKYEPHQDEAAANSAGLKGPSPGIAGIWYLINQENWTSYSGRMTAIVAKSSSGVDNYARIMFYPQRRKADMTSAELTAWLNVPDGDSAWSDRFGWSALPNLSQPLLETFNFPKEQITAIGGAMVQRGAFVYNDFVADPSGKSGVPMFMDWVMSNPLQRYYAAVDYGNSAAEAKMRANDYGSATMYGYAGAGVLEDKGAMGPTMCTPVELRFKDRNGKDYTGAAPMACGAVWTLGFTSKSPMAAVVGRVVQAPPVAEGRAQLWYVITGTQPVQMGFAALSGKNEASRITYPATWPHLYEQ